MTDFMLIKLSAQNTHHKHNFFVFIETGRKKEAIVILFTS